MKEKTYILQVWSNVDGWQSTKYQSGWLGAVQQDMNRLLSGSGAFLGAMKRVRIVNTREPWNQWDCPSCGTPMAKRPEGYLCVHIACCDCAPHGPAPCPICGDVACTGNECEPQPVEELA